MPLSADTLATLRELLKSCSAQVVGVDESRGTGFFVKDRLLLTCAHVANGSVGDAIKVKPFGRPERGGTIRDIRTEKTIDLALVDVDAVDGDEPSQPAVLLDRRVSDGVDYYAIGYPTDALGGPAGLEEIRYKGHSQRDSDTRAPTSLVLEAGGPLIVSGLSGGALLNTETGAVVAAVQYARDTTEDSGGGGIVIARAAEAFHEIRELLDEPPLGARRWRDTLGRENWKALGKAWAWRRSYDVVVSGNARGWQVGLASDADSRQEITVRDLLNLPDDVSEALFSWAQLRRVRQEDEVRLLGRLLAAAVFPAHVGSMIWRDRAATEMRVRLHVDADSTLFDVPWEFVAVPTDDGEKHVAASRGMEFVRVAPHSSPGKVSTLAGAGEAGVLGVVMQPPDWQNRMPRFTQSGSITEWPKEQEIMRRLRESIAGANGFRFLPVEAAPLENPDWVTFINALEMERPSGVALEVVHYVGFGRLEGDREELAFSDGEGDADWFPVSEVCAKVAHSGARLFVVEFELPRADMQLLTIGPRAFLAALSNRVNALVLTRFPVHPRQFGIFNGALYRELGEGATIEAAVNQARREVSERKSLGDAAAFGWFTLVTGPQADTRLLPAQPPGVRGIKQESTPGEPQPAVAATDRPVETFVRGPT